MLILFLITIPIVSADIAMPVMTHIAPFFPFIIIVEIFLFWFLQKSTVNLLQSFLIVIGANIISFIAGWFIPIYSKRVDFLFLVVAYVLTTIIEGIYFTLSMKNPKKMILPMLKISLILNSVSYLLIFILSVIYY